MLDSLTASDWIIVSATVAGPILAVQAQKWVERATERGRQRYKVFSTLMVTRGTQLAVEHVTALNSIDLVFASNRPWQSKKDAAVIEAWRLYSQQLNTPFKKDSEAEFIAWNTKRSDLFIDLLMKMAAAVGFKAEKERVLGAYHPTGHFELEMDQRKVVANAAKVFAGEQPLQMAVVQFPISNEAVELQQRVQQGLLNVVSDGVVKVEIQNKE